MTSLELVSEFQEGSSPDAPLVLFVHGRGGALGVTRPFAKSVPTTCHKLFVQAPYKDDDVGGFSWWRLGTNDSPYNSAELLGQFIKDFFDLNPSLKPSKLAGLGFSQGGALLSILIQQGVITFSQVALLASFVIPLEKESVLSVKLPEVFVAHGELDDVVPVAKAKQGVEFLREKGYTVFMQTDEKARHKVGINGMKALQTWFSKLER
jgi:predicted esterase